MSTFKEKMAIAKARNEAFENMCAEFKTASQNGESVELNKDAVNLLNEKLEELGLLHCEMITMHHNSVVIMGSALICLENDDPDMAQEWLLNTCENADAAEWQLYKDAQEHYDQLHLQHPSSQEQHLANIVKLNAKTKELKPKLEAFYELERE